MTDTDGGERLLNTIKAHFIEKPAKAGRNGNAGQEGNWTYECD